MPLPDNIVRVDPSHPDPDTMARAARIIRRSGVVIFPTQSLYGVAANALDPDAVHKVFLLKQRARTKPILVLVQDQTRIPGLVSQVPDQARSLMTRFWPGSLTLVFKAARHLPSQLTAHTGKIGIRVPAHPVAQALVCCAQTPVTGTSANLSGRAGCSRIMDLDPAVIQGADLVLDAGPLKGGQGSTVADVTTCPLSILRSGNLERQVLTWTQHNGQAARSIHA
jgi:L-threonylcarbamoyladenylate synthase